MQTVNIYIYTTSCAEKWLADWRKNDWKNAKGQQVANAEAWKEIALLLDKHTYQFIVDKRNSYSDWMRAESESAKNRRPLAAAACQKL